MQSRILIAGAGALVLAGLSLGSSVARAETIAAIVPGTSMSVTIGDQTFNNVALDWTSFVDPKTGQTEFGLTNQIKLTANDGSEFTIGSATFDPDPLLLFSANATNNTDNPLTFSFSFNAPLNPHLNGQINSHAEMGVTLTDGLDDGATVNPFLNELLTSYDLYSNGTKVSKNVDIGTLFTIASGTQTANYSANGSLVCTQDCVTMSSLLAFTLTAHDSVGFSGKVTQSPVPLPGALVLFGSGLFGLAGLRRRTAR
ncbi:MAG TPA: PEP-CTERM sorting domain-containing protein [Steroidobacteraceae bacterium]|jgi:hypothetical protein